MVNAIKGTVDIIQSMFEGIYIVIVCKKHRVESKLVDAFKQGMKEYFYFFVFLIIMQNERTW